LTAEEILEKRRTGHNPRSLINSTPELHQAVDAIASGVFSPDDRNRYRDVVDNLMATDWFLVTADFASYVAAQRRVDEFWKETAQWRTMAVRNTANVAWFSADRTVSDYSRDIWNVPVM